MSEEKRLVFFGKHSEDWTRTLNESNLLPHLSKYVSSISNIGRITDLNHETKGTVIVIPLMENHAVTLYKHNIKNMRVIAPKLCDITTFRNKYLFHKYVTEFTSKVTPDTISDAFPLQRYTPHLFTDKNAINCPVIVKPINGYASSGVFVVLDNFSEISDEFFNTDKYIVEEYFPERYEYVSHVIAVKGKIIHCVTYKLTYGYDKNIKFRDSFTTTAFVLEERYTRILELFLLPCGYSGVCNFNFRIVNSEIKVFEINPRLGGSLMKKEFLPDLVTILTILLNNFS